MDIDTVTDLIPAPGVRWRSGDAFLAGGTWLFSEPQPRLSRLLDLHAFGWPPIVESPAALEISATCTLAELSSWSALLSRSAPGDWIAADLIGQCCSALLGSFKVWNMATVGGNLCLSLPAGPMIALTAALDGVCTIWTPDGDVRAVPVYEFVTGPGRNVLRSGELLRSIELPASALRCRTAFRQISLSPYGRSAALVIGRRLPDGSLIATVTASTTRPLRFAVDGDPVLALAAAAPSWHDDVHGHPEWRAAVTRQLLTEVVEELSR